MIAGLLSHESTVGVFAENEKMLKDSAAGVMGLKDVVSVSIYNADLKLLYAGDKRFPGKDPSPVRNERAQNLSAVRAMSVVETNEAYEFLTPVSIESASHADESLYFGPSGGGKAEKAIGYVRIVLSKDSYHKELFAVLARNAAVMAIFIASSLAIVYVAVKKITRPLNTLTESVKAHGKGMPVEQVPVETADEIGNLASAFNAMVVARGRAEESLRESEERYRRLVEFSPDAIFVQREGKIAFINAAGAKLFGVAGPSQLLERPVPDLIHADDRELVQRKFFQVEKEKTTVPLLWALFLRLDGTAVDVELAAAPFTFQGLPAALVIARDISVRKGMAEQIESFQKELNSAVSELSTIESRTEERERHHIAADLHDNVGQNLALSQIRLGTLREALVSPELARGVDEIRELIGQTLLYTRSLTVELSPPVLYELGLEAAVGWLVEKTQKTHGIHICFQDDGQTKRMDDDTRFLLFKSVRELLLNIVKHARATEANVDLAREDGTMRILVGDNGTGFDPETIMNKKEGFGLFVVRKRLNAIGGSMEIRSGPGRGTRVVLTAKLKNESREEFL
jgi:PAS domain S-box-containing protein